MARLPGGDRLENLVGYEPFNIAWHDVDQFARVIVSIEDKVDVEDLVEGLLDENDA